MGIDAQLLIKVPGEISEDQLRLLSWNLCEALGAERFYWLHDSENKADQPCIWYAPRYGEDPVLRGRVYYQDGDAVIAEEGETLLEIDPLTRYYGPGYERGDLLHICAIAEWCEANIPGCSVFYGGDSSGVQAELFDRPKRDAFKAHLYSSEGRDYFQGFGTVMRNKFSPDTSACKLCIPGRGPTQYGSGPSYAAYTCHGCGQHFITRDAGVTWTNKKEPL